MGSSQDPITSPEKKLRPLYSAGERRKRESGISMWNKEGLEFYYMMEKNWREIYNDKAKFSVLINGWETWEPKDKSKKDTLRTYWACEDKNRSSEMYEPQEKDWWEQEDKGYDTDRKLNTEFHWEGKNKKMIKERLGVVDEDTDDDRRIITKEERENDEDDGEEKIVDESKEDDDNDDDDDDDDDDTDNDKDDDDEEGHQKRCSNRGEK